MDFWEQTAFARRAKGIHRGVSKGRVREIIGLPHETAIDDSSKQRIDIWYYLLGESRRDLSRRGIWCLYLPLLQRCYLKFCICFDRDDEAGGCWSYWCIDPLIPRYK